MNDRDERVMAVVHVLLAVVIAALYAVGAGTIVWVLTGSMWLGVSYTAMGFGFAVGTRKLEPYMSFIVVFFWPIILAAAIVIATKRV